MPLSVQINVTVPELVLRSSVIREKIYRALRQEIGPEIQKLFYQTVNGWSDRPKFSMSGHSWIDEVAVRVWTGSARYAYVNNGTPAHVIRPKRGGVLAFRPGYIAGTRPRVLASRRPSRFGDYVTANSVNHPGIEARDFDVTIAEEMQPKLIDVVNEAISLGVKLAGAG